MTSKAGVANRYKRPVLMLWFFTLIILVWQIMISMRTNNKPIRLTTSDSNGISLETELLYKTRKNIQKVPLNLFTYTLSQSSRVNKERKSNEQAKSRILGRKSRYEPSHDNDVYLTSEINMLRQYNTKPFENITYAIKNGNNLKSKDYIPHEVDTSMEQRFKSSERNISTMGKTEDLPIIQCKNIRFPKEYIQKEKMQRIASENSTIVYSAYHNVEMSKKLKIISICYINTTSPYYCQVWYKDGESGSMTMIITNASVIFTKMIFKNRTYVSCFINCALPDSRAPFAVAVVHKAECLPADNLLEVGRIAATKYIRNFTMCHSALHCNYNKAEQLVEWIEFNKILGAEHFLVYNFSIGQRVQKVLEYYTQQGIVEVVQWPLPSRMTSECLKPSIFVHYGAQTSAYNDCLQRSKPHSKYVVITDVDEFIVPRAEHVTTWIDMLKNLPDAGAYRFENCFFFPISSNYSDKIYPEKEIAKKYNIKSLLVLSRHTLILAKHRKKYIARTAATNRLSTHKLHCGTTYAVNSSIGLLHHYRHIYLGNSVTKDETVLDKYGRHIVNSVTKAWKKMSNN